MKMPSLILHTKLLVRRIASTLKDAASTEVPDGDFLEAVGLEERIMLSASPMVEAPPDNTAELDAQQLATQATTTNLVIIDSSVPDLEQLIDDLGRPVEGTQTDVVVLNSEEDGIEQITSLLSEYQNIESIHLVSHGSDGTIQLGATTLTLQKPLSLFGGSESVAGHT